MLARGGIRLWGGAAADGADLAEHLVAAAHEVVLTVKVLVDATEAVLAQQRSAMAARNAMRTDPTDEPEVDLSDDGDAAPITMLHRDMT